MMLCPRGIARPLNGNGTPIFKALNTNAKLLSSCASGHFFAAYDKLVHVFEKSGGVG